MRKIIIFGVDGATWDVIDPLIAQGKLPNFKRLIANGVSGTIESIDPPYTPIIWTSIATGKRPEAHGVKSVTPTRYDVDTLTIWDILEDFGHTIGIFNWPVVWPPRQARGFIVPGGMARSPNAFPPELEFIREICEFGRVNVNGKSSAIKNLALLKKAIENGMTNRTLKRIASYYLKSRLVKKGADQVYRQIVGQSLLTDLYINLYQRFRPSFSAYYVSAVDTAAHLTWKYYEPQKFGIENSKQIARYARLVPLSYENTDECIGKVLQGCVDSETALILVSDHGTRAASEGGTRFNIKAVELFEKLGLSEEIDYFYSEQGVYFSVGNPVAESRILRKIGRIKISATNRKLFQLRRSDIPGLYVIRCQDSSINGKTHEESSVDLERLNIKLSEIVERNDYRISGIHHKNGIFIASGPNFKRNDKTNLHLTDLVPTLLYYLGLPIGKDMDGLVKFSIFEESWKIRNEAQYIPTYDTKERKYRYLISRRRQPEIAIDEIKKRLRTLGYL